MRGNSLWSYCLYIFFDRKEYHPYLFDDLGWGRNLMMGEVILYCLNLYLYMYILFFLYYLILFNII